MNHERVWIEHAQPTEKIELHPAPIINARPVPPRLTKIPRHLNDCFRRSNSQHLPMKMRCILMTKKKRKKNPPAQSHQQSDPLKKKIHRSTHLLHFIIKCPKRRVPKPRSRIVHRGRLLRQRLHAIQHLDQCYDSLIIPQTP
jgi:hypothetical protein